MSNQINKITQELYQIDSSLKQHEPELIKIIQKVLASRPDTKFDKKFAKQLRLQLLAKTSPAKAGASPFNSLIDLFMNKKIAYAAGGAVLTALILIPVLSNLNKLTQKSTGSLSFNLGGINIDQVKDNAFGPLSATDGERQEMNLAQASGDMPSLKEGVSEMVVSIGSVVSRPQSGGGGGFATGMDAAVAIEPMMIAPEYSNNYRYVYTGDEITIDEEKMAVFNRLKGDGVAKQIAGLLSGLDLGLVDLSTFSNTSIDSISLVEDKDFGYFVNANLKEGMVSINQNWQKWPQANCRDQKCYEAMRIKPEDIPADNTLIKIANDFVRQYKINVDAYGEPEVMDIWRESYERTGNKATFYAPESIPVLYPLMINGQYVYESNGQSKVGLNVAVHVKERKVSSVNNLMTQNYQSSLYDVETDMDKIMKIAQAGGIYSYQYPNDQKTIDVEINTPEIRLIRFHEYRDGENLELLTPALVFPITKTPAEVPYFYKKEVVVPLVKEILDKYNQTPSVRPMPEPMPMPVIME